MVPAESTSSTACDAIADRLDLLNSELRVVRDVLDELRTDVSWGVQNGRIAILLSESESLEDCREATVGSDAVTLTIRLSDALVQLRDEIRADINRQIEVLAQEPGREQKNEPTSLPSIELFEIGDAVEFQLDGEEWFGEIADLDDAGNSAIVQLIPSFEEVEILQDLLRRIEPDELSQRWDEAADSTDDASAETSEPLSIGDSVALSLHGHDMQGEVLAVDRMSGIVDILLTPSMDTITADVSELVVTKGSDPADSPLSQTILPVADRIAAHEAWCRDVRDLAEQHTEGRRVMAPANGKAIAEYEVAPLPNGEWAVRWRHGFWCGDFWGASHPWTTRPTRNDCIELVLKTSRKMFSARNLEKIQVPIAREMLHLLGEGLFGFNEPEPVAHAADVTHPGRAISSESRQSEHVPT